MDGDDATQNALMYVSDAARRLHEVRALEQELVDLVAVAARNAVSEGAPGRVVAQVAGVTPGRVSQIVSQADPVDVLDWRARIREIADSPADVLHSHAEGFAGVMTFPPCGRRRMTAPPRSHETSHRRGYTDVFPYAAPASLAELHGPTTGQVTVPAYIDPRPEPVYFLDVESSRRALYRAVVRAGTVEDQHLFLDANTLMRMWCDLVLPAPSRALWESRIPELAGR